MSQWLDEKYISIIGQQLGHFHRQSKTTYAFRCPFCGDSQKRQNKTRGYFFLHRLQYFYKCHNCNISMSLRSFLQRQYPDLHREYQLDVIRQDRPVLVTPNDDDVPTSSTTTDIHLPSIQSLDPGHQAFQYCANRRLPNAALTHLYFTDAWTEWIPQMGWTYKVPEDHGPRLVIPWYDASGNLLGAQVRRIDVTGKEGRYITFKNSDSVDKVYGLDRLNYYRPIYIVEGPLDSWFVPNTIASMDSDLLRTKDKHVPNHYTVCVWDNEPRNKEVVRHLHDAIRRGERVVIWPSSLQEKDINDMVLAGHDVEQIINAYTFQGLQAELEFSRWNRLK